MKVLWPHNFNPDIFNHGTFMSTFAKGMLALGIEIEPFYIGQLRTPRSFTTVLKKLQVRANQSDLIHSQFGSACGYVTSFLKDKPKILSLRGSDWHPYRQSINYHFAHSLLATSMTHWSIPRFDVIVTMSKRMRSEVKNQYPQKKIF